MMIVLCHPADISNGGVRMKQSIVDIPTVTKRNKYNLQQLIDLPVGKALKTEVDNQTNARTARGVIWNFCKHRNLKSSTHTVRENGHYALFTWLI